MPGRLIVALLVLLPLLVWTQPVAAVDAKVVYVDPKLRFLVVDKGVYKDLAAGSHICLLNDSGFIVTCSGIVLANKSKAGLRFPLAEMKKLKVGSKVRLKTVYLKADGPKELKSSPKFYQAKVDPLRLPKTIIRDAVKAEKLIQLRKIDIKPISPPAPPPDIPPVDAPAGEAAVAATASAAAAEVAAEAAAATDQVVAPGTGAGEPSEKELESGQEVQHEVGKPYPEEVAGNDFPTITDGQGASAGTAKKDPAALVDVPEAEKKAAEVPAEEVKSVTIVDDLAVFFTRKIPIKFFRYEVMALRPVFSHIKFNYVDFSTVSPESSQRDSLWDNNATKETPASGFGVQVKIFGRGSWVYNVGLRYWNFDNFRSVQRLDQNISDLVADTKITVDSNAAWGELGRREKLIGPIGYYYGGGLDVDVSEVKFQSVRRIDEGADRTDSLTAQEGIIGFARSGLTILSFRSTGSLEMTMFNMGMSLTGTMILPFYTTRRSFDAEVSVPINVQLSSDGEKDLERSISHDKGKFGLELSFGFFVHM